MPMKPGVEDAIRKIPLEGYQLKCLEFMLHHPKCGIFLDIGYGKTLTTLVGVGILGCRNVLVVAPKSIARTTWHAEVKKWSLPYDCYSMVERMNPRTGKMALIPQKDLTPLYQASLHTDKNKISLFITSRDRVAHLADWCASYGAWPFDYIICDEFQSFKGGTTNRTKAVMALSEHTKGLAGLTGTPMPKSIEDVWSQVKILDGGARLGKYITHFRNQYMHSTMVVNGHAVGWQPNPGAMDQIFAKISDIAISVKADLGLPPMRVNDVTVPLPKDARDLYDNFVRTGVFDLESIDPFAGFRTLSGDTVVTPANAAVLAAKLVQIASGTIYDDAHNMYEVHAQKLAMAQYLIDNTGGNVIVAYHFQCDRERLLEHLDPGPGNKIAWFDGSEEMKDAWNRGEYKIMLLQPASNCHGINLQDGGSTLIWYSIPWSLEHYDQTIGRLYRKGQKHPVVVHRIIAEGTFDEKIAKAINDKSFGNEALLDAVRRELKFVK